MRERHPGSSIRWKLSLVPLALVALVLAQFHMFAQQRWNVEEAVRDGVRQLVSAYGSNDVEKYFRIYATDMTILRATGRWDHAAYHKRWAEVVQSGGGNLSAELVDLQVQVLPGGESAVATFQMPVRSRFPNAEAARGRNPEIIYYMTTVWAYRKSNWNIVHVHWSVQPSQQ
jgi:ketosteroid isomerase-like protein